MVCAPLAAVIRVTEGRVSSVPLLLFCVINEVRPNLVGCRSAVSRASFSEDGEGPSGAHPVWLSIRDSELLMRGDGAGGDHIDFAVFHHEATVGSVFVHVVVKVSCRTKHFLRNRVLSINCESALYVYIVGLILGMFSLTWGEGVVGGSKVFAYDVIGVKGYGSKGAEASALCHRRSGCVDAACRSGIMGVSEEVFEDGTGAGEGRVRFCSPCKNFPVVFLPGSLTSRAIRKRVGWVGRGDGGSAFEALLAGR